MVICSFEKLGLWCVVLLYGFYWGMYLLIWVFNVSFNWLLCVVGLGVGYGYDVYYFLDEFKFILCVGGKSGKSGKFMCDEWNVLVQSLNFVELDVVDIMCLVSEIVFLGDDKSLEENLDIIYCNCYLCYFYFDVECQQVLGLVYLKDVFLVQQDGCVISNLKDYLCLVQFILLVLLVLDLLCCFCIGMLYFVIIGKKGQLLQGFIMLDNMLSFLVGEICDEFCYNIGEWSCQDDGILLGKGSLFIVMLEYMLGIDIEYDDSIDLVGGLVMEKLGDLFKEGQKIEFVVFDVVIKCMLGLKIVLVKVYLKGGDVCE